MNVSDHVGQDGDGAALPLLLRLLAELPGDVLPAAERAAERQDLWQHRVAPGTRSESNDHPGLNHYSTISFQY